MTWNLTAENIAGIREGHATIRRGNNVVRAANWQGKSSFLQAIETAMGTRTPLTEGADAGRVQLDAPDGSYAVELERRNGTVVSEGEVFLDDEYDQIRANLYAFLDEDNAVRAAVRRGENLEELLTRPLDFENIEERIADLKAERSSVEAELEEAREAARRLPGVQEDVTRLAEALDELEAERAELAEPNEGAENTDREELSRLRAERSQTEQRVDRLTDAVERIDEKLADVRTEYDSLDVPDEDVSAELADVRDRRESIRTDVELLQSVYSANRRVLEEGRVELLTDLDRGLMGDEVDCWICGAETDQESIRDHLDDLSERISALKAERAEYDDRVEELESRREEIREARKRRDDLERRIDDLEAKRGDRTESLESARDRKAELDERIAQLEEAVAEHSDDLTEIKSEIKRTKADLEEKREELARLEGLADRRETLENEHDDLGDEIATLRNRKTELKRRTREAFDDAIDDLLARFDTSFETARLTSNFDLVVARDGREANVDALSEGELELLGIVAALAGHEAFEVADNVPILLLDQLGGLSEGNLTTLVDYLNDRAEFLVFTAYPEHDAFEGNVIQPSEWDVVSTDPTVRP